MKPLTMSYVGVTILTILFHNIIHAFGLPIVPIGGYNAHRKRSVCSTQNIQLCGANIDFSSKDQRGYINSNAQNVSKALERFVKEVLFRRSSSLNLTKSELELLIMEETGLDMSADMIDKMFQHIDVDRDGVISAQELNVYIQELEPTFTKMQRAIAVSRSVVHDVNWLMTLTFFTGTSVNMATNILGRSGKRLPLGKISPYSFSAWLFTIGTLKFTAQSYQRERLLYELNENAKRALFKWIKIMPAQNKQQIKYYEKFAKKNMGVNRVDLRNILEGCSVFLPKGCLDFLYSEIDKDKDGLLTKSEIETFVEVGQQKQLKKFEIFKIVSSKCIRDWGFWSNCTWLFGSLIYVTNSYMPPTQHFKRMHLNQAGSLFYWLGGFALLPIIYNECSGNYLAIEDLQRAIYKLAVPTANNNINGRMIESAFHKLKGRSDRLYHQKEGYGALDRAELFNALQGAGVLIQLDKYLAVFRQADKDGDGKLSLKEFEDFVMSVDTNEFESKEKRRTRAFKALSTNRGFWLSSLYVIAGALYTVESYGTNLGINDVVRSNMLLWAGLCYGINSGKNLVYTPITAWRQHKISELNNLKFKLGMLVHAQEYCNAVQ